MFSAPLSRALKAAKLSARSFRSVATTWSLWREARIAWTPQPVPMSSAVATGRRTVRCESVSDGLWTPATWSGASAPSPVGIGDDQQVVVGHEPDAGAHDGRRRSRRGRASRDGRARAARRRDGRRRPRAAAPRTKRDAIVPSGSIPASRRRSTGSVGGAREHLPLGAERVADRRARRSRRRRAPRGARRSARGRRRRARPAGERCAHLRRL